MSTGPVPRKVRPGGKREKIIHEIFAASSASAGTTLYKGDKNAAVAADATEATGGEWPVRGLDPNKHYKITHMRVVLGAAPGAGETQTITLRQDGVDSTDGVVTISGDTDTTGEVAFQDTLTVGAYVTVSMTGSGGAAAATMRVYLTIEEV